MQTPKSLQGSNMENKVVPPPPSGISNGDFLYHSSRKRTFTAMNQQGIACESDFGYGFARESNQHPRTGSQCEEIQFHGQTEKMHNNEANLHNMSEQPQSFHYKGYSSLIKVSDGEALSPSKLQAQSSSKTMKSSKVREQNLVNPSMTVDFDEKPDSPEDVKYETSNFEKSAHNVNSTGIGGFSTVETSSLGELCTVDNRRSVQRGVQLGSGSLNIGVDDNCKGRDHGGGDSSIQLMKKIDGSGAKSLRQPLVVAASPRNDDYSANGELGQKNRKFHDSQQSDGKGGPLAGKVGLAAAEKLWTGSIQLSSTITVSAVAFFKSGEKIPDIKWSESVEVKGKVRLEAFEKYIQDLPRSRNRGLMVISLRLKDGSSEAGLAGMKEVAKGYNEGKKVGFAQLSPGTDLYICPRSDAIITILAKHGFFKGKAAIEDDHDSLIGCVVWRRKQTLSNSVMKKPEKKNCSSSEQPPNSPSASSTHGAAENKLPRTKPASKPAVASAKDCTTPLDAEKNNIENRIMSCSKAQLDACSSSTVSSLPTSTLPYSSSLLVGIVASLCADSTTVQTQSPMGRPSETNAPLVHLSGQEKPSLEVKKPVLPPLDVVKGRGSIYDDDDDDDLPEYDFGTVRGASRMTTSKLSDVTIVDKKLSAGGFGRRDGPSPPTMPTEQSLPTFSQRRPDNMNLPRLPPDSVQKMLPVKTVCNQDHVPGLPLSRENHSVQTRANVSLIDAKSVSRSKNLFDDDDDIPEWRPPHMQHQKQVLPERIQPPTVSDPPIAPNPPIERLYPGPRHPVFPSPFPSYNNPPLPTQPRPHLAVPVNHSQPKPLERHFQNDPGLSRYPFDNKLPVNPPGWRNWRP